MLKQLLQLIFLIFILILRTLAFPVQSTGKSKNQMNFYQNLTFCPRLRSATVPLGPNQGNLLSSLASLARK